ncbi:MAG: SMP-30/gluconolactonase/LRE family protein [Devosiaceae bacterium]|nr:SMP-30/gluconolactonase/LRE family protein [Devosiaceae bacterium MH13]
MADTVYEVRDARFEALINRANPLERLWTGAVWCEGPVWSPAWQSLVWSDIPNDRRLRLDTVTGTVGEIAAGLGRYTNGSTLDREGRIVACQHGTRSVTRLEHDGSMTIIADQYEGKRLNSPNDVVVKSDGTVWFTDPHYGIVSNHEGFQAPLEQDGQHVYRVDLDGSITRVADDFACPNGLAFSRDETVLYVSDTGATHFESGEHHIRRFSVNADNTLAGGSVFAECEAGLFDGFRMDVQDALWTSAYDGVHCYTPEGALIGKVLVPEKVANVCFGGPDLSRLYITASSSLYAIDLAVAGHWTGPVAG